MTSQACSQDVPMPVVTLNRVVIVSAVVGALALGQPVVTTLLFAIIALATVFGRRASLVYAIAATMLGLAQVAFLGGYPVVGWALAVMVAVAASVALAGFCLGCFLFTQLRLASVARARS